jgi:formylglycine-generating enzyme required for sulfatase activity
MDRDERFATAAEMRAALREADQFAGFRLPDSQTRAAGAADPADFPSAAPGATVAAGSASSQGGATGAARRPADTAAQSSETRLATAAGSRTLPWVAAGAAALAVAVALAWALWFRSPAQPAPAPAAPPAAPADADLIVTAPAMNRFVFETASLTPTGALSGRKQMVGEGFPIELGEATIDMVRVPGGSYERGAPDSEPGTFADEGPVQTVSIREFFIGKHEVTQAQWRAVAALPKVAIDLPADPSEFKGDDLPVENVTWEQANEFCARLSRRTHRFYRLPSESEWEYACRAGSATPFSFGQTITTDVANYDGQLGYGRGPAGASRGRTTPVGSLKVANAFGLYDMHGNVWEWCFGQYHDTWQGAPTDGSSWLQGGDDRLRSCRGGSWSTLAVDCRSASRFGHDDDERPRGIGFRVLMRPGPPDAWAVSGKADGRQ